VKTSLFNNLTKNAYENAPLKKPDQQRVCKRVNESLACKNEHLKQHPQQMFENQPGKNTCPKMMTKTTSKTTRKTHREPCCVCMARQAHLQAHAHARKCRKGTDTQERPERSPEAQ